MIDWLLLFAYYKAHRQQPIIETVQCDEEIADKVSKLRVLGYGTGCVKAMCAGVSTGHGSHGMPCANRPTGLALRHLEPPASASLRRGKPAGILRYFLSIQYLCKPCAVNPPVLPSKHSTFSEYKQFLAFPFIPSSFSKLLSRFFFFCGIAKKKKRT